MERFPAPPPIVEALVRELCVSNVEADFALSYNGATRNSDARWYEHENDLRSFSAAHPDFLFILSGEGEESGDIWKLYAKAGKIRKEKASLTIAPYDPAKLT